MGCPYEFGLFLLLQVSLYFGYKATTLITSLSFYLKLYMLCYNILPTIF